DRPTGAVRRPARKCRRELSDARATQPAHDGVRGLVTGDRVEIYLVLTGRRVGVHPVRRIMSQEKSSEKHGHGRRRTTLQVSCETRVHGALTRGGGFAVHSRCLSPTSPANHLAESRHKRILSPCVDYVGYAQCPCERDSSGTASRAGSPESEISLLARNGLVDRDFDVRCPPRVPTAVASIADRLLPVRVLHVIRVRRGLLAFRAAGQSTGHGVLWGKREYCPIRRDEDIGELTYTINVWTAPRPQRSAAATKSTNEGANLRDDFHFTVLENRGRFGA